MCMYIQGCQKFGIIYENLKNVEFEKIKKKRITEFLDRNY